MLSQGRKTHFLYDLRQVLRSTALDEQRHRSFGETLFAKGSRISTEDALLYLREKVNDKTLSEEEAQACADLVNRYSHWR